MYYNNEGNMISFHITCYAHGYRSKWNHFGAFDQFPPETAAPVDSLFSLEKQLKYINAVDGSPYSESHLADYVVVFYFNRILRARSRRLVKEVNKNLELMNDKKIEFIYVNTDNYWFYSFGEEDIEF